MWCWSAADSVRPLGSDPDPVARGPARDPHDRRCSIDARADVRIGMLGYRERPPGLAERRGAPLRVGSGRVAAGGGGGVALAAVVVLGSEDDPDDTVALGILEAVRKGSVVPEGGAREPRGGCRHRAARTMYSRGVGGPNLSSRRSTLGRRNRGIRCSAPACSTRWWRFTPRRDGSRGRRLRSRGCVTRGR